LALLRACRCSANPSALSDTYLLSSIYNPHGGKSGDEFGLTGTPAFRQPLVLIPDRRFLIVPCLRLNLGCWSGAVFLSTKMRAYTVLCAGFVSVGSYLFGAYRRSPQLANNQSCPIPYYRLRLWRVSLPGIRCRRMTNGCLG
jgi:hypothetical protein